jgi:hypothetical protein
VAGVAPESGYRLRKINEVIGPQLQRFEGTVDGISPKNVQYVFAKTIAATLVNLDAIVEIQLAAGQGVCIQMEQI